MSAPLGEEALNATADLSSTPLGQEALNVTTDDNRKLDWDRDPHLGVITAVHTSIITVLLVVGVPWMVMRRHHEPVRSRSTPLVLIECVVPGLLIVVTGFVRLAQWSNDIPCELTLVNSLLQVPSVAVPALLRAWRMLHLRRIQRVVRTIQAYGLASNAVKVRPAGYAPSQGGTPASKRPAELASAALAVRSPGGVVVPAAAASMGRTPASVLPAGAVGADTDSLPVFDAVANAPTPTSAAARKAVNPDMNLKQLLHARWLTSTPVSLAIMGVALLYVIALGLVRALAARPNFYFHPRPGDAECRAVSAERPIILALYVPVLAMYFYFAFRLREFSDDSFGIRRELLTAGGVGLPCLMLWYLMGPNAPLGVFGARVFPSAAVAAVWVGVSLALASLVPTIQSYGAQFQRSTRESPRLSDEADSGIFSQADTAGTGKYSHQSSGDGSVQGARRGSDGASGGGGLYAEASVALRAGGGGVAEPLLGLVRPSARVVRGAVKYAVDNDKLVLQHACVLEPVHARFARFLEEEFCAENLCFLVECDSRAASKLEAAETRRLRAVGEDGSVATPSPLAAAAAEVTAADADGAGAAATAGRPPRTPSRGRALGGGAAGSMPAGSMPAGAASVDTEAADSSGTVVGAFAARMVARFIAPGAPLEINVQDTVRRELLEAARNERLTYAELEVPLRFARREVMAMLDSGPWPRFTRTPEYAEALRDAKAMATVTSQRDGSGGGGPSRRRSSKTKARGSAVAPAPPAPAPALVSDADDFATASKDGVAGAGAV